MLLTWVNFFAVALACPPEQTEGLRTAYLATLSVLRDEWKILVFVVEDRAAEAAVDPADDQRRVQRQD